MPLLLLRLSRVMAFALLSLSLLVPWFRVPVSVREDLNGNCTVVLSQPESTIIFKGLVLTALLIACFVAYRRRRARVANWPAPLIICGSSLLAVLGIAYPSLTMQRCAEISAHAGWLQAQNYSLTLPTGDTYRAQEFAHDQGQGLVNIATLLPRAFEALPTPVAVNSFSDLRLSRLEELLMWLGLSPSFCQFIYRGWFCGIFGAFLLVVSFMRTGRGKVRLPPSVPLLLIGGTFLACVLCLIPIVMAGRDLLSAQKAVAEERLSDALHYLDRVEVWVPVLAYNTDVIYQRAWLENKLGIHSDAAQLFSAIREEEEGFSSRAALHYSEALRGKSDGPFRGEAYRGALRLAIEDFNAGLTDRAGERFKELQAIDSSSVKVNYALQLAYFRIYRKEELEREVARFEALYGCFQSLEKSGLIASAHRRTAELDFDFRDIPKLGEEMRAAINP